MNAIISISTILVMLLLAGITIGRADRNAFEWPWLWFALALVLFEDALLTNLYGFVPVVISGDRNWQGKALALSALLIIATRPRIGWERVGLTWRQRPGSLLACLPVVAIYLSFFVALALALPDEGAGGEDLAFQLTMPGMEEELFYRGLLLFALNEAFRRRCKFLGIDWGWGALLSSVLFGLAHGFSFSSGAFAFDPIIFGLTAIPSLLGVWLRERSGSLLLPVIVHNAGNSLPMLL